MSIDSDAQKDLALDDDDAAGIVGGARKAKKSAKHTAVHHAAVAPRGPLMIQQTVTYGPTEVSANSGDDDCAPEYSGDTDATS